MRFIRFFVGAVLGGLIGAVVVILFTPVSGEQMRAQVNGYFSDSVEEVRQAASARRAELEKQLARLRMPSQPPRA